MKKYIFEVTINEGNDEYWEELEEKGISGCDEMLNSVNESLQDGTLMGADFAVKLVYFTDGKGRYDGS